MEEKELEILLAATKEFSEKGFFQTKTEDIANRAGVSKGLVFHYFKSKKNLYNQVVKVAIQKLEELFDYTQFPNDSLVNLFDYSLKRKFEIAESHAAEMALMLDVYGNLEKLPEELQKEIFEYIEKMKTDSYEMIAQIIRQMPIREGVREEDVVKLILTVFNQVEIEAKQQMSGTKITDYHFFDKIIGEASRQVQILESGFLK
ncbi:MAG: TetR/AcrR family transcriptional regulator [Vagococcus sp.]|uniref:TetR/AcrR family transcriptional regulator n=1 Tax=Vagococcus TaxID=2737 RepID=UPI002FC9D101